MAGQEEVARQTLDVHTSLLVVPLATHSTRHSLLLSRLATGFTETTATARITYRALLNFDLKNFFVHL